MRILARFCLGLGLGSALLGACRTGEVAEEPSSIPAPDLATRRPPRSLAAGWSSSSPWEFERTVARLEEGPWDPTALEELGRALEAMDLVSLRAAVLLAHGEKGAREVLLERLEARVEGPERHSDAADVVAAHALAHWPSEVLAERLAALAEGPAPHPDLEVRVECGAVALEMGRDEVVPFLLRVLAAGTPAELEDPADWAPTTTLAWAKGRASEALSRRAGVPNAFQADGSFQQQMNAARDLERRLREDD